MWQKNAPLWLVLGCSLSLFLSTLYLNNHILLLFPSLLELMSLTTSSLYVRLAISSLNYTSDSSSRTVLSKALTSTPDVCITLDLVNGEIKKCLRYLTWYFIFVDGFWWFFTSHYSSSCLDSKTYRIIFLRPLWRQIWTFFDFRCIEKSRFF